MMSEYTAGPWVVGDHGVIYDDKHRDAVCELNFKVSAVDRANAKLIAAAPDLLEALQALLDYAESGWDHFPDCAINARKAIAKALA